MQINLKISLLLLIAIGVGITFSITPAFASTVTITPASGSGALGCEETYQGCYLPKSISVNVGDKVIFKNTDTAAHTFTAGIAGSPSGAFDSRLVVAGSSYEWTPTTAGKVPYFCMVHPWMDGLVIVKAKTSSTLDKKIDDAKKVADAKKAADTKKAAEVKQKIIDQLKKIPYCDTMSHILGKC